jgi:hypothetical protein
MAISKLNELGQLISEAPSDKPPIVVSSNVKVDNLNADKLDGVEEINMLRTNANRTLSTTTTLTVEGTVEVSDNKGKIKVGDYEIKSTNGIFHIDFLI